MKNKGIINITKRKNKCYALSYPTLSRGRICEVPVPLTLIQVFTFTYSRFALNDPALRGLATTVTVFNLRLLWQIRK